MASSAINSHDAFIPSFRDKIVLISSIAYLPSEWNRYVTFSVAVIFCWISTLPACWNAGFLVFLLAGLPSCWFSVMLAFGCFSFGFSIAGILSKEDFSAGSSLALGSKSVTLGVFILY